MKEFSWLPLIGIHNFTVGSREMHEMVIMIFVFLVENLKVWSTR